MTDKERKQTRNYLYGLINANRELTDMLERKDYLLNRVMNPSIHYSTDRVQTSGSKDMIGDIMSEIRDIQVEADKLTDEYIALKERLKNEIKQIPKEKFQDVLIGKYVDESKIGDIADKKQISYRTCTGWIRTGEEEFFELHKHKILYNA